MVASQYKWFNPLTDQAPHGNGLHPSQEQIATWINPTFEPSNFFYEKYEPSMQDIEDGNCSITRPFSDGVWTFLVFYATGHHSYLQTPVRNGGPSDTHEYPERWEANDEPRGPLISYYDDFVMDEPEDAPSVTKIQQFINKEFHLDVDRNSEHFRSELDLNLWKHVDLPFLPYNLDEDHGFWDEKYTTFRHLNKINGHKYEDIKHITFQDYREGSSYSSTRPNLNIGDFKLKMNLNPHVHRLWSSSYQYSNFKQKFPDIDIEATMRDYLEELWDAGQSGWVGDADTSNLQSLVWEATSNVYWFSNHFSGAASTLLTQGDNPYSFHDIENIGPVWSEELGYWNGEVDINGYYHGTAVRPGKYYLRLDNELYFGIDGDSVPENLLIRIINLTESGDYTGGLPEDGQDMTHAPVFYDYTLNGGGGTHKLETAPWWDINGMRAGNWSDNLGQNLNGYARRRHLRIRLPLDFTFEKRGQQDFKILYGWYDPQAAINYDAMQGTTDLGGAYGMPLITSRVGNYSGYNTHTEENDSGRPYGLEDTVSFFINNNAPRVRVEDIRDYNNDGDEVITWDAALYSWGVPSKFTTYDGGVDYQVFGQETALTGDDFNESFYRYYEIGSWEYSPSTNTACYNRQTMDNIAATWVWDLCGNISSDYTRWNFTSQDTSHCPGTVPNLEVNFPRLLVSGQEYTFPQIFEKHGAVIHADQSGVDFHPMPDNVCQIYSCNMVAAAKAGLPYEQCLTVSSKELIDLGYFSLETSYNDRTAGWDYLTEILDSGISISGTEWANIRQKLDMYTKVNRPFFHITHLPTEEQFSDWYYNTSGAYPTPKYFPRLTHVYPNQEIIVYSRWYDFSGDDVASYFETDPFIEGIKFLVDHPCIATGKYGADVVFNAGGDSGTPAVAALQFAIANSSYPQRFSVAAYTTGMFGNFCDIDGGLDFEGGSNIVGDFDDVVDPDANLNDKIYWYSKEKDRWDIESLPYRGSENQKIISVFTGKKGEIFSMHDSLENSILDPEVITLKEHDKDIHFKGIQWISKKLNMGMVSQDKMYYKIRLITVNATSGTEDMQVWVRNEKNQDWLKIGVTQEGNTVHDIKIPRQYRRGKWIQIKLQNVELRKEVEVSSITVIWRAKAIK